MYMAAESSRVLQEMRGRDEITRGRETRGCAKAVEEE